MSVFHVFSLLGGLAMFLFGMDIMGKALEQQAGGKLQSLLSKLTDNPFKGFLLGLVVTSIIQSSSATTVMVVGFVNSGIMKLHQAIGIIMGSNVGTTVTAWLLSLSGLEGDSVFIQLLKPSSFSPILAFVGILLYMFIDGEKKKGVGTILLGFSVLMTGMSAMSDAMAPLENEPWFTELFVRFTNPLLGVLAGAILTGIIQSSSASVGILQALSSTGAVTFGSAIPIIMGQNIGTCVTAMIASVGTTKNARRTALIHLYFNVIGVILFLCGFFTLNAFFNFTFLSDAVNAWNIAVVHTAFNVITTAILLPFNRLLEKLAYLSIPDKANARPETFSVLDELLLDTPAVAVAQSKIIAGDMAEVVQAGVLQAMSLTHKWDTTLSAKVLEKENAVDKYEDALGTYLIQLSRRPLTIEESRGVSTLLHCITDFERISDHAVSLNSIARDTHEKQVIFSPAAQKEISVLECAVQDILQRTIACFEAGDLSAAAKIEPLEQVVDQLVREIKTRHVARLQNGTCSIAYGFVLGDLLNSYRRIADHCSNIAVAMIEVAQDSFDTHAYLNDVKENSEDFNRYYERYRARYLFPKDEEAIVIY